MRLRSLLRAGAAAAIAATLVAGVAPATALATVTGAPSGLAPNDATTAVKDPVLRWSPVGGASTYDVEVSPNPDFTNNITVAATKVPGTRWAPPQPLPHASYWWHVRAVTSTGSAGPWSDAAAFRRGWTDYPHNPTHSSTTGLFRWDPVDDASAYEVEFSRTPDFPNSVSVEQAKNGSGVDVTVDFVSTGNLATATGGLAPDVTNIDAAVEAGVKQPLEEGQRVLVRRQTTSTQNGIYALTNGTLVRQGGADAFTVDLIIGVTSGGRYSGTSWRVASASPPVAEQYFGSLSCVVNHPAFAFTKVYTGRTDVTPGTCLDYATAMFGGSDYYWRVRGRDATLTNPLGSEADPGLGCSGITYNDQTSTFPPSTYVPECSLWSSPRAGHVNVDTFTMPSLPSSTAPITAVPTLTLGGCGTGTSCTDTPWLTWTTVGNASSYFVYVALDPEFTNIRSVYQTPAASYAPRGSLPDNSAGSAYYVAVQGCNAAACGDIAQLHFTKRSTAPTLTSPTDRQSVPTTVPTLRWTSFLHAGGAPNQEARDYRVQVSTDPSFATTLENVVTDCASSVADQCEYTSAAKAYPGGLVYWRVQPYDASGNPLTWSATRSIVLDVSGATATITTANGVDVAGTISVGFSEPVTGVGDATLQLAPVGSTTPLAGHVTVYSATSATIRPTAPLVPGQSYQLVVSPSVRDPLGHPVQPGSAKIRASTVVATGDQPLRELWRVSPHSLANGGSFALSAIAGASSAVTFTGTDVELLALTGSSGGYGDIYLDGSYVTRRSFYSATTQSATLWSVTGLTSARHVAKVVVVGSRPAGSHGDNVSVDAWVAAGTTRQEAASDTSGAVTDTWGHLVATDSHGGVMALEQAVYPYAGAGLATASADVYGTGVTVVLCKGPYSGSAYVFVDGVRKATVSLYRSWSGCANSVATLTFAAGLHRVAVGVNGVKPSGSKGARVGVDAFVVK